MTVTTGMNAYPSCSILDPVFCARPRGDRTPPETGKGGKIVSLPFRRSPQDERALQLESLVRENIGWLQGWLRGRLGDPELVHDVTQEAFLRACRHLGRLKDPERFSRWLYRTAQNLVRDHYRSRKRRRTRLKPTEELDGIAASPQEDRLGRAEEAEKLLEAVRSLPSRYREPFILRHTEDLSYERIAAILGISTSAVQVRMFRARKMLRERYDERREDRQDR